VAARRALGPRWYAEQLSAELVSHGLQVALVQALPPGTGPVHAHLGNSTRNQLLPLATRRTAAVVTLHDVVPRQRLLRRLLARPQARLLRRHRVVVHSRHAVAMLRRLGFPGRVSVIAMGASEERLSPERRTELRKTMMANDGPMLVMAGVLKRERGSVAVLQAASRFPNATFVLMGPVGDVETRRLLAEARPNVRHLPSSTDRQFAEILGAADVLLNFRLDTVGETSAPMVQAHAWGTPMAGFRIGSFPEYAAREDLLFEPGTLVDHAIKMTIEALVERPRIPHGSEVITSWRQVAEAYLGIYSEMGWLP
jgi:glycosyltransferase involved in cell wall biosynthesis